MPDKKIKLPVIEKIKITSIMRIVPKIPRGMGRTDGWRHTHTTFGHNNKCSHCPNFAPIWLVAAYIEGAKVDGFRELQNFYKTLMLCNPCKDKFVLLAKTRERELERSLLNDAKSRVINAINQPNNNPSALATKG